MPQPVRLLMSSASPFARKCMVLIRERGIEGIEETPVSAIESPDILIAANPIAQVPALIFDDGSAFYDSTVICAYLDTLGSGAPLSPNGDFAVRCLESGGNAVMEACVRLRNEVLRPETERSPTWQARWRTNINRALDVAEADEGLRDGFNLGIISWGCALGYLDYRHGDMAWRTGRPNLDALAQRLNARPSFLDTQP